MSKYLQIIGGEGATIRFFKTEKQLCLAHHIIVLLMFKHFKLNQFYNRVIFLFVSGERVMYCLLPIENISPLESYDYCTITPIRGVVTIALPSSVYICTHQKIFRDI